MIKFTLYGDGSKSISFDDLLKMQEEEGTLWAHPEESGSESCYCEVARWNEEARQWQRYCFIKCMDFRLPGEPDWSDEKTAAETAKRINERVGWEGRFNIVHRMHNFTEEPACQQS